MTRGKKWLPPMLFALAGAVLLVAMQARLGLELGDDGGFFLRYAENMLKGEFWVWNSGEAPVWGASAPLYPVFLAIPLAFNVPPVLAAKASGMGLAALSLAGASILLYKRFGFSAWLAFICFAALDTGAMYFPGAGLETPMTFACLVLGLWALQREESEWFLGLAAGLLAVNKLDLVPFAGLLLLAYWVKSGRFPLRASVIAAIVALAWYLFAWWHFGAPVPNSFLTKALHQGDLPTINNWRWIGTFVLWVGSHKYFVVLALIAGVTARRDERPIWVYLAGGLLTHLIAYTIKFPFEPYNWYAMPSVFVLLVLASIGVSRVAAFVAKFSSVLPTVTTVGLIGIVGLLCWNMERLSTNTIKEYSSNLEHDRAEAGRWVARNTPKDFTVATAWGNPAFFSERKVIDMSFLNRPYEAGNLIEKYRPEILILQNGSGSTPMNPEFPYTERGDYRVVQVFDQSYAAGEGYFYAVLARKDMLSKIQNKESPQDLLRFCENVQLGDIYGVFKPYDKDTLFVHPGLHTTTNFRFDVAQFAVNRQTDGPVRLRARISPRIPPDAIARGAGVVKLTVVADGKAVEKIIRPGQPFAIEFSPTLKEPLSVVVDSQGNPDTDWLLISID